MYTKIGAQEQYLFVFYKNIYTLDEENIIVTIYLTPLNSIFRPINSLKYYIFRLLAISFHA